MNFTYHKGISVLNTLLPAIAICITGCVARENKNPNILLIVADDLGWNDVGYHGSEIKTPNIDKLANEGIQLNRFYVHSVSTPTRATLLTGRYPDRYGISTHFITIEQSVGIPEQELTIAEMLGKTGYKRRGLIGKWHLGHSHEKYHPLNQGFTYFYGHYMGGLDYFTHKKLYIFEDSSTQEKKHVLELDWHEGFEPCYDEGYTTDLIRDKAINFLKESNEKDPFFLYVAFNAPHTPLQAKEADLLEYGFDPGQKLIEPHEGYGYQGRGNTDRQTFSAMVTAMDKAIGDILEELENNKKLRNTLVIFFSDNGATVGGSNYPLKGGKFGVYEGGIRVPCIVRWPGIIPPGSITNSVTGAVDILPTLQYIVGAEDEPPFPLDGINILNILKGGDDDPDRAIFIAQYVSRVAITRSWKLHDDTLLFKIDTDPHESENVADLYPEIFNDLNNRLNSSGVKSVEYKREQLNFKLHPEHKIPRE